MMGLQVEQAALFYELRPTPARQSSTLPMSENGKRSVAQMGLSYRAHSRLYLRRHKLMNSEFPLSAATSLSAEARLPY
jgi:hypothetical protein